MNIPGFTEEALSAVHELLFEESNDKRIGVCGARSEDKIGQKTLLKENNNTRFKNESFDGLSLS
jgi:hypothetical protein